MSDADAAAARAVCDDHEERVCYATVPASFSELSGWLERPKARTPKRMREVAAFVLASPDEIAFGPLAKLTDRARIPSSAFVRFAQSMGFRGFAELQAIVRGRLISPGDCSQPRPADEVLSRCVRDAQQSLRRLDERTSRSMLLRGARTLAGA